MLEIHHSPKHGSWLNISIIELSDFTRQCIQGRIGDLDILMFKTDTWTRTCNCNQKPVDWQLTAYDARLKLKDTPSN
jgi:hypothetical protein